MTTAPDSNRTRHARATARAPRPLPGWWQAGFLLLLVSPGLPTLSHRNEPSFSANAEQTAPGTTPLARFAYTYPAGASEAGNLQPTFQYSAYYAPAPSTINVMPILACSPTPGRWIDRDPLPAK